MGLTYSQAKALGIGHLHPAFAAASAPTIVPSSPTPHPSSPPEDGMDRLERSFRDDVLDPALATRGIVGFAREPLKFRLAGRTWYTPDFAVTVAAPPRLSVWLVEVKGFLRDDAAVKIKVAAALYPDFTWLLAYRRGRQGWRVHRVTDRGIGVNPIEVSWIHGGGYADIESQEG